MKKITIILSSLFLIVCSCLFVVGCEKKDSNNLTKIKVAEVTHSIFYAPLYVALENGYFEDNGLDVELILTSGADKVAAAVLSNDVKISQ